MFILLYIVYVFYGINNFTIVRQAIKKKKYVMIASQVVSSSEIKITKMN